MSYIMELRQHVGHRPLIMVGAGVAVLDEQNRILLQQRADNHMWSILGGSMEPGETLEEVARREAREEAGIELGQLKLFGIFSGPELFYEYPNGDQVYNVGTVYLTRQISGELKIEPGEVLNLRFFPLDRLPEISPPDRPILKALASKFMGR